ncbi:hypothetical protein [Bradyrhizobium sp.]|uniref:hypothetical protein n=1 Tax=Bradyrhizobium sp. TaxID=376 RepID=UPI003C7033AB
MQGKPPGCLGQRAFCFRELLAYLRQQLAVGAVHQPDKDVVEKGYLVGCQSLGVTQEKLGNPMQDFRPPFGGPSINRVQFRQ